ncbi:anti-sigma factor antagonist [Roseovarius spongiae]|uniref:Anti-sigma factor antagonist n=1 Tax=Roseovarius spongiae TaxID=2320272 RepID=A0A3A8AUN5_9RHOB|nr:STAS domain-containing protein [Roseovarius spongiae]RKF13813.1 anti-sigma factor antagonist [Roseovarius spongiae]
MELSRRRSGPHAIVTVNAPRIDASAAIRFKDAMREIAAGDDHIILDLRQVRFIDSSGLGAIVAALKHLGPGKRMDLAALTPDVDKVFRLTRMDTIFVIHEDPEAAMKRASG